ncbi:hypothetical protein FQN55_008266 [Onygenales sp. PD_40]|nr:hypothetical protein FQN55_008266 [Onygenales sp. PD_40]KAK2785496.1 hypothetical protein FQN52_008407 [Onygenales sp. PD_12]KAK2791214.1 hypothetical protein FQN53_006052 [Emmonsiellopsis sp. PD_33]KAK2793841.1 hypothetical protein FQN51_000996 [Onygenales sp. PD_10]
MTSNTNKGDVFHSATSSRAASVNQSSSVRPRNRRLISLFDGDDGDDGSGTATATDQSSGLLTASNVNSSPPRSRNATPSPRPSRHPSRAPTDSLNRDGPSSRARLGNGWMDNRQNKQANPLSAEFWESSWSSLQGLASVVLGNEEEGGTRSSTPASGGQGQRQGHRRKPSKANFVHDAKTGPSSWGPSGFFNKQLGMGTKEERQSMVQALKRQTLLQANGNATPDSQGNYKRRDSGDGPRGSVSVPPPEQDDSDALVYVHHVQANDSITGVCIRYGCQPAVMRKANGFWPSDSIQARKTVLLPVEACTLKGRRIPRKEEHIDLLSADVNDDPFVDNSSLVPDSKPTPGFGYGDFGLQAGHYSRSAASSVSGKAPKQAPQWTHECWVQVDEFPDAVEIGRVSRRTLGFFPRARRKSQVIVPYSDSDDTAPSLSKDITHDINFNNNASKYPTSSPLLSPSRDRSVSSSKPPSTYRSHRHRGSFTLSGPGGVGTLGRSAEGPGPSTDKLNKFINTHLPHLAVPPPPPSQQLSSSPGPPLPRASMDSTSTIVSTTSSTGLENVGGAIEGWVRKMARGAKSGITELQQQGSHLGIGGMGDLIELDDTPDGKGDDMGTAPGSGGRRAYNIHEQSPTRQPLGSRSVSGAGSGPSSLALGEGGVRGRRKKGD